jgi:hypothetical protein
MKMLDEKTVVVKGSGRGIGGIDAVVNTVGFRRDQIWHKLSGKDWGAESIASDMLPAFAPSFYPNEFSADVFPWDPI